MSIFAGAFEAPYAPATQGFQPLETLEGILRAFRFSDSLFRKGFRRLYGNVY